jgi:hypothetical protein
MGLLKQKIKELPRHSQGRPDTLKAIFQEIPEDEKRDFIELLFSDIEATTIASAIQRSGLSQTANNKTTACIAVAIRRFRQGDTKFFAETEKWVAS